MMRLREQWGRVYTPAGVQWDILEHCGPAQGTLLRPGQFNPCICELEEATLNLFVDVAMFR